jgi:hypothetical protein
VTHQLEKREECPIAITTEPVSHHAIERLIFRQGEKLGLHVLDDGRSRFSETFPPLDRRDSEAFGKGLSELGTLLTDPLDSEALEA